MTSTQCSVGIDDSGGNSTSIMKPPGGDCHDIFGADFHGTPSHHRVLKPPGGGTSGLFAPTPDETDKPRSASASAETVPGSHVTVNGIEGKTNGVKSGNESLLEESDPAKKPVDGGELDAVSSHTSSLSSAEIKSLNAPEEKRRRDGNPVTGEGYDTPETQAAAPQRARIPPGGYSSGLW